MAMKNSSLQALSNPAISLAYTAPLLLSNLATFLTATNISG